MNTLQQVTAKLANAGNLAGKRTNHSLRATSPTRLYQSSVDKKQVCELTGHRSNAVLEYKHTSNAMQEHASQILYGNSSQPQSSQERKFCETMTVPVETSSKMNTVIGQNECGNV